MRRSEFVRVWMHAIFSVNTVCLCVFFAIAILIADAVPLHIRDPPITFDGNYLSPLFTQPFRVGVPTSVLTSIVFCPLLIIPPLSFAKPDPAFPQFWLASYLYAIGLTNMLTISIKNHVGYFRPHAFFECKGGAQCAEDLQDDLRHSFPSGHSSESTMALLNVSMSLWYFCKATTFKIQYRFVVTSTTTFRVTFDFTPYVAFLCLIPFLIGLYISVSRIHDNDHFPADVIAGALIGSASTALSFGLFEPR